MRRKLLPQLTPRRSRVGVLAVMVSVVFSAVAIAAAGDLDPSFSGDGKQTTDFGFGADDGASEVCAPGRWQDLPSRSAPLAGASPASRLCPCPLQPEWVARPGLLRGRQTEDQLRRRTSQLARGVAIQANGKIVGPKSAAAAPPATTSPVEQMPDFNASPGSLDSELRSGDGKQVTDFGRRKRRDRGGDSRQTARSSSSSTLDHAGPNLGCRRRHVAGERGGLQESN